MDYRLVKQFSNNSIDSFFNFFYKIVDFAKVLIDLGWAFLDIWYHFFMIFINAWLYVYYFILFVIDRLTVTGLFTQKAKARHSSGAGSAFGFPSRSKRVEIPSPVRAAVKVSSAAQSAAKTVVKTVEKAAPGRRPANAAKRSVLKDSVLYVFDIIRRIISAIVRKIIRVVEFLSFRMRPTRDESPSEKKSLIDEYMREYEKKKK